MESKEQPNIFQIDRIADDSPALKDQREWLKERERGIKIHGMYSIYNLVPGEGKVGIAPAIFTLTRAGILTIDKLTRLTEDDIEQLMLNNTFGTPVKLDSLEKALLLQKKALAVVKAHPILLSRN